MSLSLVAAGVLLFLLMNEQTGSNTLILDDVPQPSTVPTPSGIVAPSGHPNPPAGTRGAVVTALADGDSFDIRWNDSGDSDELRLVGINAPESSACFGDAARGVLQVLTSDADLVVETVGRDEFGRGLANVWVGDVFVNARLVELGAALAQSEGGTHAALLVESQQRASTNKVGLWDPTFCGIVGDESLTIVGIESDAPGQDNLNPNGEWIDVRNEGSVPVDLTGWSIRDESTRHRFSFPDGFSLEADTTVRVFSGCGDDDQASLYWCDGDPVWNNGGDTGFLVDTDGRFVDTFGYSG